MKKLLFALIMGISTIPLSTLQAQEVDNENFPVMYLRGSNYGEWGAFDAYRLHRENNVYSIHMETLSGEFKLSNTDWTFNFGADIDHIHIFEPVSFYGVHDGKNFKVADALSNVDIYLTLDDNHYDGKIKICINGDCPEEDDPFFGGNKDVSGTLPVLYINVYNEQGDFDNEVIDYNLSHKNYFSGEYWLDLNGCEWMEEMGAESVGSADEPLPLEIKARGNWTRKGFSKKPFKLKLGKKQTLLGMSKSKHFAILAHADDNMGYLRNFTGFNLGRRIGLPWTPDQQPVEVVINGDYRGLYFLTESIRIEKDRVNITELEDGESDLSLISGGYLVELDNYDEDYESQIQMNEKGEYPGFKDKLRITFDTPEVYSDYQRMFVNQQFTAINDNIGDNSDDLWSYLDLDDAARYYIVCELMSHVEAYHGSTYLFRDRGENQKWHFSPLWDFGNGFVGPTDGYIYDHAPYGMTWIGSINYNQKFKEKVRETWKWFMSNGFNGIYDDMATIAGYTKKAAQCDHKRWGNTPPPFGGSGVCDNSDMDNRLEAARNHLKDKANWLKDRFGEYADAVYAEPERDTTPAAPLPEFITTDLERIENVLVSEDVIYYTLQGHKVSKLCKGEIYIKVDKTGAHKTIVK